MSKVAGADRQKEFLSRRKSNETVRPVRDKIRERVRKKRLHAHFQLGLF